MQLLTPPTSNDDHMFGNPNALIELVEYGDYECPYCGKAYPIVKDAVAMLGNDIKFVFRNFPLAKVHPHAFMAAVASEAAGLQGRFWEMHDIIFENQRILDTENILLLAGSIGLNLDRFKHDIHQQPLAEKVEHDFESGLRSGVNRTPTFFINGRKYEGDWTEYKLLEHLRSMLIYQEVF